MALLGSLLPGRLSAKVLAFQFSGDQPYLIAPEAGLPNQPVYDQDSLKEIGDRYKEGVNLVFVYLDRDTTFGAMWEFVCNARNAFDTRDILVSTVRNAERTSESFLTGTHRFWNLVDEPWNYQPFFENKTGVIFTGVITNDGSHQFVYRNDKGELIACDPTTAVSVVRDNYFKPGRDMVVLDVKESTPVFDLYNLFEATVYPEAPVYGPSASPIRGVIHQTDPQYHTNQFFTYKDADMADYESMIPLVSYTDTDFQKPMFGETSGTAALEEFRKEVDRIGVYYPDGNVVQGRVLVDFVIGTDGSIEDVKIVRSPNPQLDSYALYILGTAKSLWSPGFKDGAPVRTKVSSFPVTVKP